jgi:mRNA interferase RelE/StbE
MKVEFNKSFAKDLLHIKDPDVLKKVEEIIIQIENTEKFSDISQVKKLKGDTNYYRIRLGNYRIGIKFDDNIIYFIRILHRKEIYRYFP